MFTLMRGVSLLFTALTLSAVARADLISEIVTALESAVECGACNAALVPIQALAHLGNNAFVSGFTSICELVGAQDNDVCAGELSRTGPILAHSIRKFSIGGTTSQKFCNAVFGLCQEPSITPFSVPFPSPAPTNPKKWVSKGNAPFQVVQLSDAHIDTQYVVGSNANCTKPICCRTFADSPATTTDPAGPFGNSKCDPPVDLATSMLSAVKQFGGGAKFMIFTGDVEDGDTWLVDQSLVTSDLQSFDSMLASSLNMPVFPSIGNHDAAPVNSFPRNITHTTISSQWVFDTLSAGWERWIGSAAAAQVDTNSGSYAAVPSGTNLRIIAINTLFWYKQNFWLYDTDTQVPDPNGVLAFMVDQLQAAEDAGQRAWIIGHIPAGKSDVFHDQSNYYDQVIQRYKNTIAAQFFGHSHKDQFEIAYSDYTNQNAVTADSISFIAPALTPTSGNPAFKIYDIDPDTYEVMDSKVYFTNISSPTFQNSPTWDLYYSARAAYGPLVNPALQPTDSLNASFWHRLTEVFSTNDTAFFEYNERISRGAGVSACTGTCRTNTICDMRAARAENSCDVVTPGLHFKKRDSTSNNPEVAPDTACGGASVFAKILTALQSNSTAF
ncbi:sphingomyelin phosphodiesterase [Vararia minispora EC-137]|uniref:Sphingomyelin phosphodiesterase n=1 Tax=Vararia minispora EC-137 TaxID=1314806 RepID=A0ACB8QFM9_9AGAM|nr:sphingomyelin phosphodiesterase [Vararia minispora EC-137]